MNQDDCPFCNRDERLEDIVYESDNFFVLVGLGLVVPGHVMLITKEHYHCYAELPAELENEFEEVKSELIRKIGTAFSEPYLTENGIRGQSIPHAHLHIIPLKGEDYKVESIIEEMIAPGDTEYEEADAQRIKEVYRDEGMYLSIEEAGKLYVCHVADFPHNPENPYTAPRAFFRKIKGLKGVRSWRKMSEEEKELDEERRSTTRERLKAVY